MSFRRLIHVLRMSPLVLVLGLASAPAAASEAEATAWLQKMSTALREQNYVGTFTFMRGNEFNTMRIAHRFEEGRETERILQLNGERREIVRTDSDVTCYHHVDDDRNLCHNVPLGPFSHLFNESIAKTRDLYNFTLRGKDRIANRDTVILDISPRGNDRYGYRLLLDEETGLLLQSQLVDRNRVREQFQFAEITIGGEIDDALLVANVDEDTVKHKLTAEILDEPSQPTLRVSWLPDGFRVVRTARDRMHFSDGIATFSVFIERKKPLPELATRVGGTAVITRTLNGAGQITVIGEVPVATAQRVAESVEPVIY